MVLRSNQLGDTPMTTATAHRVGSERAIRVRKSAARKLYNHNLPVVIVACKLWPFGGWAPGYHVHKSDIDEREDDWTFDQLSRNYEYANCSYETGYYPAYYVDSRDAAMLGIDAMETDD